jgi:hypothetical protein
MGRRHIALLAFAACGFRAGALTQDVAPAQHDGKPTAHDAAIDAVSCTSIARGSAGVALPTVTTPPTIDGNLDDWSTCFIDLDGSNAQNIFGSAPYPSGKFALEYSSDTLYLAAQVTGIAPLGSEGVPDLFLNNAVELYVDGDGLASAASYDAHTAQLVVDHNNAQQWFVNGQPPAVTMANVTTAVELGSDGVTYSVEAAVPASALGLTQFASPFGFDIDWTNGNGTTQLARIAWAQVCDTCTMDLCCDAREFGSATLAP